MGMKSVQPHTPGGGMFFDGGGGGTGGYPDIKIPQSTTPVSAPQAAEDGDLLDGLFDTKPLNSGYGVGPNRNSFHQSYNSNHSNLISSSYNNNQFGSFGNNMSGNMNHFMSTNPNINSKHSNSNNMDDPLSNPLPEPIKVKQKNNLYDQDMGT